MIFRELEGVCFQDRYDISEMDLEWIGNRFSPLHKAEYSVLCGKKENPLF